MSRPPVVFNGRPTSRTTCCPGVSVAAAASSPIVRPVTVGDPVRPAGEAVARPHAAPDQIDPALARDARDALFGRIGRRHTAAPERRDAEELDGDRHGVRGELAAARAGTWARYRFERRELA